jgi:subtilisin family serine protease
MVGAKWGFVAGSSFAAAHLTGLVALLRELSPNLRPQQIREALAAQAIPSLAGGDHHAIVDACAAVARIAGVCACACAVASDTLLPMPP